MQYSIEWISYDEWDIFDMVSMNVSKKKDNLSLTLYNLRFALGDMQGFRRTLYDKVSRRTGVLERYFAYKGTIQG